MLLKGCETKGYVILSAAKAEIHQRVHRPVWKDRTLVSKTTWTGRLECMQYYATVNAGENDSVNGNIFFDSKLILNMHLGYSATFFIFGIWLTVWRLTEKIN